MFRALRFIIDVVVAIVELLLVVRFFLIFFAANPFTPFVAWVYNASAPLVAPFFNIFPSLRLGEFVIDTNTLAALIVYALIGSLLMRIFSYD